MSQAVVVGEVISDLCTLVPVVWGGMKGSVKRRERKLPFTEHLPRVPADASCSVLKTTLRVYIGKKNQRFEMYPPCPR